MKPITTTRETCCCIDEGDGECRLDPSPFHHASYQLRQMAKALRHAAQSYADGGSLLDYGCGTMPYKAVFAERVREYRGADLRQNERADIVVTSRGTLPVQSGRFEIVLSTQVLEHVEDPARYLAEARRVLSENGIIILSTHGSWHFHPTPRDYWRWTSEGLRKVIEDARFEIVSFRGIMGDAATASQLWQDAVLLRLPKWVGHWFKFVMQKVVALQDTICSQESRDASACVYLLVARKAISGRESPSSGTERRLPAFGSQPSPAGRSPAVARPRSSEAAVPSWLGRERKQAWPQRAPK